MAPPRTLPDVICGTCRISFHPADKWKRFCSRQCSRIGQGRMARHASNALGAQRPCKACGVSIVVTQSMQRYGRYLCDACANERFRKWKANNLEASRQAIRNSYRRHTARRNEDVSVWRAKNPEKRQAQICVTNAIRSGVLLRPTNCEQCAADVKVSAHHEDYLKPLDVQWLCSFCHKRADMRRQAREKNMAVSLG